MSRKESKKPVFLSLFDDSVFKLLFKSEFIWFYRDIIFEYTGIDINDYDLYDNETNFGKKHNKDDFRFDILLKHKNKEDYLDIELNSYNCKRRNEIYLHSLAVKLYNKLSDEEKDKTVINVSQINFNLETSSNNSLYEHIALRNDNNKIVSDNFQFYNYNIYINKNKSYNNDKKLQLMVCKNYEEMEKIVEGDERLMTLVEKLKELGEDDEILSIYTAKDDMEMRLSDARIDGRAEGRTDGITETARNMLKAGIPIDKIQQCTGMSESAVRALM